MKFLKILLLIVIVIAIVLVGVSFLLPSSFVVERTTTVNAPGDSIYALVGHVDRWPEWTAWTKERYPSVKYTYGDKTEGVGAESNWTMDEGNGSMVLTSASPDSGIAYTLTFEGAAPSAGAISWAEQDSATVVTWRASGDLDMIGKLFVAALGGMDALMGPDFETGLANLKSKVEAE